MTKVYDTAYFIERAIAVHGNKYDYSKSIYVRVDSKLIINCPKHGDFEQKAQSHLNGHGCKTCSTTGVVSCLDTFIKEANRVHNGRYDYSLSEYKGSKTKLIIVCREHGEFLQSPNPHLKGHGCAACAGVAKSNTKVFVAKAIEVHSDRYDYSLVKYKGNKAKVDIICQAHGAFKQTPNSHLDGQGCPDCKSGMAGYGRTSFQRYCKQNRDGLGLMYVIKCFNGSESFYKIGITSRTIAKRFHNKLAMPYDYKEVYVVEGDAAYIYDLENKIHKIMHKYKYRPSIDFDGRCECFTTIKPTEKLLKKLSSNEQLQLIA